MKKALYYVVAGLMFLASMPVSGQYPDTSVVNHYPPKISMYVYNVLKAVAINASKQQVLARLYVTEDSLVAKARPEQMDSIRSQTWAGFQSILTPDELNRYISYYQVYGANQDTNTTTAFQAQYFNNRIAQLDSVKPLSKKVKAKLAHDADSICKQQQGLTLERVFINAFYNRNPSLRDTTYVGFLMRDGINITVYANASYYTSWYTQNYHISAACKTQLYPLYLAKERQLALMRYTGATSQEAWQKKYTKITTLYDSLVYRLMVFDGKASPDSTLYYTLYYKDFIRLSASQVSSVYETAIQLYHLQLKQTQKNPTKPYDKWKFVRAKLKTILDDDQYDKMLLMKNMDKANKNAVVTWKNMKADSLTQWLDSVKTTAEIKVYLLRRYMTGDTFEDDKAAQKTHLKALEALAPYHMKRFHARRKKKPWPKATHSGVHLPGKNHTLNRLIFNSYPYVTNEKLILLSALLLSLACAFAQAPDSSQIYDSQLNAAYDYANTYNTQSIRPYNPEKAFAICLKLANKGIPRAMNAVGLMYQAGLGTDTSYTAAAAWFEKAGQAGYAVAWVNLGMMYKYVYSVNQDMDKAYSCYQKASDLGNDYGKHALGYMLFKGLGGRQDYAAAFQLFRESTESNNLGGMYMLGICYRNGYGTERDTLMAKKWLKKTDSLGFYVAPSELYAKEPENRLVKKTKLKSSRMVAGGDSLKPQTFKRIKNKVAGPAISAEYAGYVITYDHSGQHIIKQAPLRLTLKANGNVLTGQWIESDTLVTDIRAQLTDTCILFTRAQYRYTDHYNTSPTLWKFTKASLDIVKTGDSVYLVGNLQLYSPETMEPEKPIYISLVKISGTTNGVMREAKADTTLPGPFIAFPNPFFDELNLDFTLEKAGEVAISIFDMSGNKVYEAQTTELPIGRNTQAIPLSLLAGMYIVKITSGSYKASSMVLKR